MRREWQHGECFCQPSLGRLRTASATSGSKSSTATSHRLSRPARYATASAAEHFGSDYDKWRKFASCYRRTGTRRRSPFQPSPTSAAEEKALTVHCAVALPGDRLVSGPKPDR